VRDFSRLVKQHSASIIRDLDVAQSMLHHPPKLFPLWLPSNDRLLVKHLLPFSISARPGTCGQGCLGREGVSLDVALHLTIVSNDGRVRCKGEDFHIFYGILRNSDVRHRRQNLGFREALSRVGKLQEVFRQ
jgi:hypothetical protein